MAIFGGWRVTRVGVLFIIGIIVLAGLVTGGIFLVKNRGEAVRREEAVKIAEQNLEDQSRVAVQPVPAQESTVETAADPDTTDEATAVPSSTTEALPQTGPSEVKAFVNIVIVAILALSASYYVTSRRTAKDL